MSSPSSFGVDREGLHRRHRREPDARGHGWRSVLFYPFRTSLLRTPLLRTPNEDFFTFNLLRFAPPDPVGVDALIAQNRNFFDEAVLAGGVHYPLGSIR